MPLTNIDDALALIRLEYAELPGLRLTVWQAQRLWNLTEDVCASALQTLIESRFLAKTIDGTYVLCMPSGPLAGDSQSCRTT